MIFKNIGVKFHIKDFLCSFFQSTLILKLVSGSDVDA